MRRISRIAIVVLLVSCGIVRGGPVLLGSFDFGVDTEMQPGNRIGFVLQLLDVDNDLRFLGPGLGGIGSDVRLGPAVFWDDGETGVLEFTRSTNPDFDAFASFVTDGIDDSLIIFWRWEDDGGFGGNGALESEMFGLDPDLIGNMLELVRLTVHEVSLEPLEPDLFSVGTRVTYDFVGTPIPEPTTVTLLAGAVVIACWRRKWSIVSRNRNELS